MCSYLAPCDAEIRHPETNEYQGVSRAYASGSVVRVTNKRVLGDVPCHNMNLSVHQMEQRDKAVDAERAVINQQCRSKQISRGQADTRLQELYKSAGSKGSSEHALSGLHYWDIKKHAPYAVYHLLYLGIAKDMIRWLLVRIGAGDKPAGELVLPFKRPRDVNRLLQARRGHFVLRDKPDCIMVDFTVHSGCMSMSEMQLLYEVGVPYLCHDLEAFGVPPMVVAMWLLLRHGMIIFTRLPEVADTQEYRFTISQGKCALYAFAAISEHFHSAVENGINQFSFTWKLHAAVAHLAGMMMDSGHTICGNDTWVERLMRHKASQAIKYATFTLSMHCTVPLHLCGAKLIDSNIEGFVICTSGM
jgi:hypothetical protein